MLCRSRKPYAGALASRRSPCTPQRSPRLQLPTSCSCGVPHCAGTSRPACGLWSGWEIKSFGEGWKRLVAFEAARVGWSLVEHCAEMEKKQKKTNPHRPHWCLVVSAESRLCLSVVWGQSMAPPYGQGSVYFAHRSLLWWNHLSDTDVSSCLWKEGLNQRINRFSGSRVWNGRVQETLEWKRKTHEYFISMK